MEGGGERPSECAALEPGQLRWGLCSAGLCPLPGLQADPDRLAAGPLGPTCLGGLSARLAPPPRLPPASRVRSLSRPPFCSETVLKI